MQLFLFIFTVARRGSVNHVTQIYDEDGTVSPGAQGT